MPRKLKLQTIFNRSVLGVIRQGKPAINESGGCMYRTPDGLKCAAGQLIADEDYHPGLEGNTAGTWQVKQVLPTGYGHASSGLIRRLQGAHDVASTRPKTFLSEFKAQVAEIARAYGLKLPEEARL